MANNRTGMAGPNRLEDGVTTTTSSAPPASTSFSDLDNPHSQVRNPTRDFSNGILGSHSGVIERLGAADDERFANRVNFRDAFTGDPANDDLGIAPGRTFVPTNDLQRLEVLAANEGAPLDRRLSKQLQGITDTADRVGESQAVIDATNRSGAQSNRDDAQFERTTRGMDLSDRQKRSANKRLGLSRSLNRANIAGNTRRGFTDRSKAASRFGGGFSDALFGQRAVGETAIGQAFGARRAAENKERADEKSGTASMIGSVVGGVLAMFSSEDYKDDDGAETGLLDRLKNVRVNRWNYKGTKRKHIGPFAEEFNREFGVGEGENRSIAVVDALGVTLGAIKELNDKVEARGNR